MSFDFVCNCVCFVDIYMISDKGITQNELFAHADLWLNCDYKIKCTLQ